MRLKNIWIKQDDAQLCNNLGAYYSNLRNVKKAIQFFKKASQYDSTDALYLTNLGQEYLKVGQITQAINVLYRGIKLDPMKMYIRFTLAKAYAANKQFDSAEVYFDQCFKAGTADPKIYFMAASVKRDLNKLEESQKLFGKAIMLKPGYIDAYQSLGILFLRQNVIDSAVYCFKQALDIDTTYYKALISLGAAYALNKEYEKADSMLYRLNRIDTLMGLQMLSIIKSINAGNSK